MSRDSSKTNLETHIMQLLRAQAGNNITEDANRAMSLFAQSLAGTIHAYVQQEIYARMQLLAREDAYTATIVSGSSNVTVRPSPEILSIANENSEYPGSTS